MRIINGKIGGLFLSTPNKMPFTRPTTQIAKQGLFNILTNYIDFEGLDVLDLFGGTGNITFEFFSRGSNHITTIEKDAVMFNCLKINAQKYKADNVCQFIQKDVFTFLDTCTHHSYDFIFAGPPYALSNIDDIPKIIFQKNIIKKKSFFVLEHTLNNNFENTNHFLFNRKYGTTVFSFFMNKT